MKWWLLSMFTILGPPTIAAAVSRGMPLYRTSKNFKGFMDMFACYLSLDYGVNFGLSLFHPMGSIKLKHLEDEFKTIFEGYDEETIIKFHKGM
jgi:hypothetical protein